MYRRFLSHSFAGLGLALSFGACTAPDLGQPCPTPPGVSDPNDPAYQAALAKCFPGSSEKVVNPVLTKPVDILFLIDNSTSMSPKQKTLGAFIPQFIKGLNQIAGISYRIGVTTSDVGTLPVGTTAFPGPPDPRCGTAKGDDGLLQNLPCTSRTQNVSAEFTTACNALCPDPTFVPTDRWISNQNGTTNVKKSIVGGVDVGPENAFKCMALVGDSGCGVEQQFEASKRALDGHLTENKDFLRPDSVLAVIYITDEDDCSVQMGARSNENPSAMTCNNLQSGGDPAFNCYNLDYRCMGKSVTCSTDAAGTQPEDLFKPGVKHNCKIRTDNNYLEPIEKYVRFFANLRTPDKLLFAGIWSPTILDFNSAYNPTTNPTPASLPGALGNGQLDVESESPPDNSSNLLNRGKTTQAACYNPDPLLTTDPVGFRGQAQIRLSSFIRRFDPKALAGVTESSICNPSNFGTVLTTVQAAIQKALVGDCLDVKPNLDSNGNPACLVGYVDSSQRNGLPDNYLPVCSSTCCNSWAASSTPYVTSASSTVLDPTIVTACTPEAADCYCAVANSSANKLCPATALTGVWRKGNAAPPAGKVVNFRCAGTRPVAAPAM
jgi:hypothetical protein